MKNQVLLIICLGSICHLHAQEKKQPDLMHNPQLYFSRLPDNAQQFLNECLFHYVFNTNSLGPLFTRHGLKSFAIGLQQIKNLRMIDAQFLNSKDKVNFLFSVLFAANYSKQIKCSDILLKLRELLPDAPIPEISKNTIHHINIHYYTPQEIAQGLRKNHIRMGQEYLNMIEAQHINRLYLPAGELATWKLIQLMKPNFNEEHNAPYDIKIKREKDARIAPQVAHLLCQGAYAEAYCYSQYYLLTCAATWRMPRVVELLLKAGANPKDGVALWWAKGTRVTKLLLAGGANPNIKFQRGHTAIFPDPGWPHYFSVGKTRLLLQAGADPNINRSEYGFPETPLNRLHMPLKESKE